MPTPLGRVPRYLQIIGGPRVSSCPFKLEPYMTCIPRFVHQPHPNNSRAVTTLTYLPTSIRPAPLLHFLSSLQHHHRTSSTATCKSISPAFPLPHFLLSSALPRIRCLFSRVINVLLRLAHAVCPSRQTSRTDITPPCTLIDSPRHHYPRYSPRCRT